jgi:hypothetical protein
LATRHGKRERVRLFHWDREKGAALAARLRDAGYQVDYEPPSPAAMRALKESSVAAAIVDLSRSPATARDLALWLRRTRATRAISLLILEGDPEKTSRLRKLVPDAVFVPPGRVKAGLRRAIDRPPSSPVVPASTMAGYSGTPLPKKLGIKEGSVVILAGAPARFEKSLKQLPDNVTFRRQARGRCELVIWFARSRAELERRVARMGKLAGKGGLWIAWPKKSSGAVTDLTQNVVRAAGLAAGLVDYKICSIDARWSGLRFARRKVTQKKKTR